MPASRRANSNDVNRSRCFPTPLVKNIRLGTMSLPNAVYLRHQKNEMENAQFNTTLCKGKMNFMQKRKNGGTPLARLPPLCPDSSGEGPGKNRLTLPQRWLASTARRQFFAFANPGELSSLGGD